MKLEVSDDHAVIPDDFTVEDHRIENSEFERGDRSVCLCHGDQRNVRYSRVPDGDQVCTTKCRGRLCSLDQPVVETAPIHDLLHPCFGLLRCRIPSRECIDVSRSILLRGSSRTLRNNLRRRLHLMGSTDSEARLHPEEKGSTHTRKIPCHRDMEHRLLLCRTRSDTGPELGPGRRAIRGLDLQGELVAQAHRIPAVPRRPFSELQVFLSVCHRRPLLRGINGERHGPPDDRLLEV